MAIQILPPQLANQIAAGEVVERPASVVKELVENALDAGARQIDIEIEKGGARLIRIRDDGCGIAQHELTLALSRHATSKISSLDDLEQIVSLGFRGEALASISSVARLSLTSRPQTQDTAWQASAEGREMQVQLKPAAHPVGSTVEVLDLFFNTPARRKFLRTEKTEFFHIDELIKRLALSRFDVGWTLSHNGQVLRRLKPATDQARQLQRVATLCGRRFGDSACWIENQHQELRLWGWLLPPAAIERQANCQYSYVNGRMMRDKLLNHAIRQAYGDLLTQEQQPAFVLFLELPASEVDVNVHPAKHEVRFHQARLVHDFVSSALENALRQLAPEALTQSAAIDTSALAEPAHLGQPVAQQRPASERGTAVAAAAGRGTIHRSSSYPANRPASSEVARQLRYLDQLRENPQPGYVMAPAAPREEAPSPAPSLLVVENRFVVLPEGDGLQLRSIAKALAQLSSRQSVSKALLIPLRLKLVDEDVQLLQQLATDLAQTGFDLVLHEKLLIVRAVPLWLQQSPLAQCLLPFCQLWQQAGLAAGCDMLLKAHWLDVGFLADLLPELLTTELADAAVPLDLSPAIQALEV
ncbi:MAG: DNA mismatch repair endonuclease MutL [Alkalimonas sp.]|nr:DNA mismatch repair endonuclease MutL [Alkalimonas sp.]